MDPWLWIVLVVLGVGFVWGVTFGDDDDLDSPFDGRKWH